MTDELDRFRTAWEQRAGDPPFEHGNEDLMKGILRSVMRLDRRQLRRDVREVAIAAGATGALAATLLWATEPWLRAWILILSATAGLIAVWKFIALFRRRRRRRSTVDSLATFCRAELSRLDNEIRLQRTLPWWYLVPILVGTNLYVFVSSEASTSAMMVFFPFSAVIVAAIALATRRSLRRELLPLRAELKHCLAELEADGGVRGD